MGKLKVVVAMSGGVDSSVAAVILKEQGFDVIGVTMCFNLTGSKNGKSSCCGMTGINDAKKVSSKLGIKHYVLNFGKKFQELIIDDFISSYKHGQTPNPCIRCNEFIKFDCLLKAVQTLGADYLATGHYAKIKKIKGESSLLEAEDKKKDQSYFLYRIKKKNLARILFPLGNLQKSEVRKIAQKNRLAIANKKESQDICFLQGLKLREYLDKKINKKNGPVTDEDGNKIGEHSGLYSFTIGQRFPIGGVKLPYFVYKKDVKNNLIFVSNKVNFLLAKKVYFSDPNWIGQKPKKIDKLKARIRYHGKLSSVKVQDNCAIFSKPQRAVTPGQSIVFYKNKKLIGGGIIKYAS